MGWKWGISGGSRNCFAVEMGHWGQVPPHRRHDGPEGQWAGRRARGWREGGGAELRQISANQRRGRGSAPAARSWGTPWVAVSRARGPARPVRRVPGVGGKGVPTPEEGRGREAAPLGGEIRAGEGARRGTTRQKPREKKEEEEGAGRRKPRAARLSLTATKWRAGGLSSRTVRRLGRCCTLGSGSIPWSLLNPIPRPRERQVPGAVAAGDLC